MSPQLAMALHKRGLAFDRSLGASVPADEESRCAVQRIRPGCRAFTSEAIEARRRPAPRAPWWRRLIQWVRTL